MNGVEGAHHLRPRSRMVASTPFRIGASQRSIAFRGHASHANSVSRLRDGRLLDSSLDRNIWRPSAATPAQHHGLGALDRLRGPPAPQQPCTRNALGGPLERNRSRMPYSKCSAASSSCSMISMLCGHIASHAPHWMQSLARPGAACQLYCCLANSVFSV